MVNGVVITNTGQIYSTKPELKFCADSKTAHGVSEICDDKNLWQWHIIKNTFSKSFKENMILSMGSQFLSPLPPTLMFSY